MALAIYNGFNDKQRMKGFRWLKAEIAAGRRTEATKCDICGQTDGVLDLHSEDYSEPFGDHIGEFELCWPCHLMLHCRFKNVMSWEWYLALIRDGMGPPPAYRRDFRGWFVPQMLGRRAEFVPRKTDPLVLRDIQLEGWRQRQQKRHGRTETEAHT